MTSAIAELTWLHGQFKELGVNIHSITTVFGDSKAATQITTNPIFHERTKHIEIDCYVIRDKIKTKVVKTSYVHTKEKLADLLTKCLG